jgi:protein translocase SecG subunit
MQYVLFGLHLIISFLICVVVLLQRSKGNGLAGAFGGVGAGEAMFGTQGVTTFLHKATIYLAVGFMFTSLSLAWITATKSENRGRALSGGETVLPVGGALQPTLETTGESTGEGDAGATPSGAGDIVPVIGDDPAAATDSTEEGEGGGGENQQDEPQGGGGGR